MSIMDRYPDTQQDVTEMDLKNRSENEGFENWEGELPEAQEKFLKRLQNEERDVTDPPMSVEAYNAVGEMRGWNEQGFREPMPDLDSWGREDIGGVGFDRPSPHHHDKIHCGPCEGVGPIDRDSSHRPCPCPPHHGPGGAGPIRPEPCRPCGVGGVGPDPCSSNRCGVCGTGHDPCHRDRPSGVSPIGPRPDPCRPWTPEGPCGTRGSINRCGSNNLIQNPLLRGPSNGDPECFDTEGDFTFGRLRGTAANVACLNQPGGCARMCYLPLIDLDRHKKICFGATIRCIEADHIKLVARFIDCRGCTVKICCCDITREVCTDFRQIVKCFDVPCGAEKVQLCFEFEGEINGCELYYPVAFFIC